MLWANYNHKPYPQYCRTQKLNIYISNSYTPTYTSRPYVYYVGNPIWSSTISLKCIYAHCVDTHWHAAHYSPPAFDRPRSKSDVSDESRRRRRRSRQKKLQLIHPSVQTNYIWSTSCLHPRWLWHASARSSHGFNQQASNVLWWILTQSSLHQTNS